MLTRIAPEDIKHYSTPVQCTSGVLVVGDPSYVIATTSYAGGPEVLSDEVIALQDPEAVFLDPNDLTARIGEETAMAFRAPIGVHNVIASVAPIPTPDTTDDRRVVSVTVRLDGGTEALRAEDGMKLDVRLGTDIGMVAVHDPLHTIKNRHFPFWDGLITKVNEKHNHNTAAPVDPDGTGTTVWADSGFGDGFYHAYAFGENGVLTGILVEFIDDYEYDLWLAEDEFEFMAANPRP